MREFGNYAAYRDVAEQAPDLVVHLGDYIYEYSFEQALDGRRPQPEGPLVTLGDFRLRHASYRTDLHLQAAHRVSPFVCMWDDHEFANNYTDEAVPDPAMRRAAVRAIRAASYRAYWEHLPLRLAPPDGPDMTIYRDFVYGDLAAPYLLDERQYADVPPCRTPTDLDDFGDCEEIDQRREYLGRTQQAWLAEAAGLGETTWNLIGNPTAVAGVNSGSAEEPAFYLDSWAGIRTHGAASSRSSPPTRCPIPVVLTGDYHAGMVADVHLDPADRSTPVICTELMAPAISSVPFGLDPAINPHVRHAFVRNGYLLAEISHDAITATFRVVEDVGSRRSPVSDESRWRIRSGDPQASPA